ncbi:hypothetical protein G6F50_015858 [Rhizopus delemar]|uniref:Uncharacterized protein n=1 Tax=Rhizopus delemar TaxID=936053 RepID=A0A9P7C3D1_9FUNG|nr:hypothetical protein G6F50_015858 [Rhizopus delemar]
MPPITITTSVRIRMGSPMPVCADRMGPAISPASPASTAPSTNSSVFSRAMFTPSAPTIMRSVEPARISMPSRVRWIST